MYRHIMLSFTDHEVKEEKGGRGERAAKKTT